MTVVDENMDLMKTLDDAWHSQFANKKECTNFMKNTLGNTTAEANVMCQKIVPHE